MTFQAVLYRTACRVSDMGPWKIRIDISPFFWFQEYSSDRSFSVMQSGSLHEQPAGPYNASITMDGTQQGYSSNNFIQWSTYPYSFD
jgi:hypothetical protein